MKTLKKISCLFFLSILAFGFISVLIALPNSTEASGLVPLYSFTRTDTGAHFLYSFGIRKNIYAKYLYLA